MSLSRGFVARNMLQTDVKKTLLEQEDVQLILFVPYNAPDYFMKEVEHPRVTVIETENMSHSGWRKLFSRTMQKIVYSKTAQYMLHYGGRPSKKNTPWYKWIFVHPFFSLMSRMKFFIPVFRWLDYTLYPEKKYDHYFETHKPDLFIAAGIKAKRDMAMMKSARRFNVCSVGMTRSWDNLDRMLVQFLPNKIVVQNEAMKDLGVRWHKIPEEDMFVTGFPQFDLYEQTDTFESREVFCEKRNLDPVRKTIMFGSEGAWAPYGYHIAQELIDMANNDEFCEPVQIIVRPHFSDINLKGANVYDVVDGRPNTYYDNYFRVSKMWTDKWDPSWEEMKTLANQLYHADILVTYASTLCLEAAILDTPIINIAYPHKNDKTKGPFMGLYYNSSHFGRVTNSHATRRAHNKQELKALVNRYLKNPEYEREQRKKLGDWLAPHRGASGKRLGEYLLSHIAHI